jgi:hypothetical protein
MQHAWQLSRAEKYLRSYEKESLQDLSVEGRIILKWILNMLEGCGFDLCNSE